ncbi:ER lumen protein retaining receptor domain-containing protein [Neurospora intermedia]|uniref:ER lumen protein retaining receptor domain-containing protein n=1 Tax=Neurospora intermedia TaxID=5142 RepID=A0ABR3DPY0_NEUIN
MGFLDIHGISIFRWAADLSHLISKCILLYSIHRNRSAEGVSLITQVFYTLVFITRYTDLFGDNWWGGFLDWWNFLFKIFYLSSSFYTIAAMQFFFPRTREREKAWKFGAIILGASLLLSPFVMMIGKPKEDWGFREWLWVFSQILESVCVLPQLLLLRQTTVPTVITSLYIVFLGSYRALYILNWIVRALDINGRKPDGISIVFGLIQTALYADFAWVYWTRQRVKLRNGGVVDSDDLQRGWLLTHIFGNKRMTGEHSADDDEESAPALGGRRGVNGIGISNGNSRGSAPRSKWGARGISVSADDGVLDHEQSLEDHGVTEALDPDAKMHDPDDLARALDDDDDGSPSRAGGSVPLLGNSSDNKNNNDDRRDHDNAWADD